MIFCVNVKIYLIYMKNRSIFFLMNRFPIIEKCCSFLLFDSKFFTNILWDSIFVEYNIHSLVSNECI